MIPVNEAIETGVWLRAELSPKYREDFEANEGESVQIRVKILGLSKIDLAKQILHETPQGMHHMYPPDRNIWALTLNIVNLCKRQIQTIQINPRLLLADEHGYEYSYLEDPYLSNQTGYGKENGLSAYSNCSFPPKIKRLGSLPYELPEEIEQLFFKIGSGTLSEA